MEKTRPVDFYPSNNVKFSDLLLEFEENSNCTGTKETKKYSTNPGFFGKVKSFVSKGWELKNLGTALNNARKWNFGEIIFGMNYYFKRNKDSVKNHNKYLQKFKKECLEIGKSPIDTVSLLRIYRFSQIIRKGFKNINKENVNKFILDNTENILYYDLYNKDERCGFILFNDCENKNLVLAMRGTKAFGDLMVDVNCKTHKLSENCYCHKGMFKSAKCFFDNKFLIDLIKSTLLHNKDYEFWITGHSLGGGVAAILTIMFKKSFFPNVRCVTFGTPPVFSKLLSEVCREFITTIVADDDCVPYLSQFSIQRLHEKISMFEWRKILDDDLENKRGGKWFLLSGKMYKQFSKNNGLLSENALLNDYVELFPPGKIFGLRMIEGIVYLKEIEMKKYLNLEYFSNYKTVKFHHSIKNSKDLLKVYIRIFSMGYKKR